MQTFAVVINGVVDNVIQYDGGWESAPPEWLMVPLNPGEIVSLGWGYSPDNEPRFHAPETKP